MLYSYTEERQKGEMKKNMIIKLDMLIKQATSSESLY